MSRVVTKPDFGICENKDAEHAKLISAFIFATRIVRFLYLLISKFQASSSLLWLYSPVCIGPGRKPRKPFFLTSRLISKLTFMLKYVLQLIGLSIFYLFLFIKMHSVSGWKCFSVYWNFRLQWYERPYTKWQREKRTKACLCKYSLFLRKHLRAIYCIISQLQIWLFLDVKHMIFFLFLFKT